jgi:hypothetical protein
MTLTPRTLLALAIVQMDHTLVDIMVVDEVLRESMGRPWITVAFAVETRVVLGRAHARSAFCNLRRSGPVDGPPAEG